MSTRRIVILSALLASLTACSNQSNTAPQAGPGAAPAQTAELMKPPARADGPELEGIVLRFAPGGRPDAFCVPEWSIANQTAIDIPGLLIQIAWHGKDGEVLQAVGEFGTLQEGLSPGRPRTGSRTGSGSHTAV